MQLETLVQQIRSGQHSRKQAVSTIYNNKDLRGGIHRVVKNILGSNEKFDDIFNFTIVQFLKNVLKTEKLEIHENLNGYLFGIARYLCLAKLREHNKTFNTVHQELALVSDDINVDLQIINSIDKENLQKAAHHLDEKCTKVLAYWALEESSIYAAQELGFASETVYNKKKYSCMKSLAIYLKNTIND